MYPITQGMRFERRKAAEKRQAAYALLSKKERHALCLERRGESRRERAKIAGAT